MNSADQFPELKGLDELFPNLKPLEKLGEGGVCSVFRVLDTTHDRQVALKIMHKSIVIRSASFKREKEMIQRFHQECRLGVKLPELGVLRIPKVYSDFKLMENRSSNSSASVGRPGMLMQYIPGNSLKSLFPLSDNRIIMAMLYQVAETLMSLHQVDVLHGDLTPDNAILAPDGKVWILDLGIARTWGDKWPVIIQNEQPVHGKKLYMPPEVQDKNMFMTSASDMFTFACFICFMFTGKIPPGDTELNDDDKFSCIPENLRNICIRCLKSDPDLRPDSRELFDVLHSWWMDICPDVYPQKYLADWLRNRQGSGTILFPQEISKEQNQIEQDKVDSEHQNEEQSKPDLITLSESIKNTDEPASMKSSRTFLYIPVGLVVLLLFVLIWKFTFTQVDKVEQENRVNIVDVLQKNRQTLSDRVLTLAEDGQFDTALDILDKEGFTREEDLVQLIEAARDHAK